MMRIRTEKTMRGSEAGRVIQRIVALKPDQLPEEYLKNGNHCYKTKGGLLLDLRFSNGKSTHHDPKTVYIKEGEFVDEQQFQQLFKMIRRCGDRLHRIKTRVNNGITWRGKQTLEV